MLDFDGTSSVSVASSGTLNDVTQKSIVASVFLDVDGAGNTFIFGKGAWLFFIEMQSGRKWVTWDQGFSVAGAEWHTDADTIVAGTKYVLGLTYDNSSTTNNPKFYINGISQNVTNNDIALGTFVTDATTNVTIASTGMDGKLSDIAFWNTLLTDDEMLLLGTAKIKGTALQVRPSNLVSYWPMDEVPNGVASTVALSMRDRVGTNNGSPASNPVGSAEIISSYP